MDKENLYYLVVKGTNDRRTVYSKDPFIADSDAADLERKTWANNCEKISIADFEEKFVDKDAELARLRAFRNERLKQALDEFSKENF